MTDSEYSEEAAVLRHRLMGVAMEYIADSAEADDMVQDAMLRLWNMRVELHSPMEPMGRVLVRNLCIDRLRRRKPVLTVPLSERTDAAAADDADGREERSGRIDRMMAIVDGLPEKQQTVLRLRHMQGMDMAELAELTGSTEVALRKALSRARQAVRDKYNERKRQ